jgi:hypothetical protein
MKSTSCGWRSPRTLGQRSYGQFGGRWRRGKPRLKDEGTAGVSSYFDHVANAASFEAFNRHEVEPLLSAESLQENASFLNFEAFAKEYPQKFFALLAPLRPEFQEIAIEYYVLHKSQAFIGKTHGFIQTRTWQALRIIEQTIGAFIVLGTEPSEISLRPILKKVGLEHTIYGSLAYLIRIYAESRSYAAVSLKIGAPVPAVRKLFRPAIATLLADKDIQAVVVGAYLRNLTHQASLTKVGLSKSCTARLRRVKHLRFVAPPTDNSPLISFGATTTLHDMPWCMFEISSAHRMDQLYPVLKTQGKRLFGKKAAQIFAPVNAGGELAFGYIFARCALPSRVRALTRVRGISEMAATCNSDGAFVRAVTISNAEVQVMIAKHDPPTKLKIRIGDFVEILTGAAARYHGEVTGVSKTEVIVRVSFPTGRQFTVTADATCIKPIANVPAERRAFWGVRPS